MSRASIIAVVVLVALVAAVIALSRIDTEVPQARVEMPVKLQGAAGDAAPAQ